MRWHWNAHERVAVAPGIACFSAGNEYAHGGLSLQESLVPVIRVTAGKAAANATAEIAEVNWAGLRCRIRVELARIASIRDDVLDPGDSLYVVRSENGQGFVVLEGNRRLSALRVQSNPDVLAGTDLLEGMKKPSGHETKG